MAEQIALPVSVTSKTDIIRMRRELETVDTFMQQAKVRKAGEALKLPNTSQLLNTTIEVNQLNLLQEADRQKLSAGLKYLADSAPVVHISFAASPSPKFMERLTTWFRQEIDPRLLVEVGLQPSIAAGCTLRTKSKYFDFSLRKHLAAKKPELLDKMRSLET